MCNRLPLIQGDSYVTEGDLRSSFLPLSLQEALTGVTIRRSALAILEWLFENKRQPIHFVFNSATHETCEALDYLEHSFVELLMRQSVVEKLQAELGMLGFKLYWFGDCGCCIDELGKKLDWMQTASEAHSHLTHKKKAAEITERVQHGGLQPA